MLKLALNELQSEADPMSGSVHAAVDLDSDDGVRLPNEYTPFHVEISRRMTNGLMRTNLYKASNLLSLLYYRKCSDPKESTLRTMTRVNLKNIPNSQFSILI